MKKTVILFTAIVLCSSYLFSQGSKLPAYGQSVSDTLVNAAKTPASFYFKYCPDNGTVKCNENNAYLLQSDSAFYAWLLTQGTAKSADERRKQYAVALTRLIKELFYTTNNLAAFDTVSPVTNANLLYSPVVNFLSGGVISPERFLVNTLVVLSAKDTACNPANFRLVNSDHYHLAEFRFGGQWAAIDPNPASHALLFAKHGGGFYSVAELNADTARVNEGINRFNYKYTSTAGRPIAEWWYNPAQYAAFYTQPKFEYEPFPKPVITNVSGTFILPPGASLVFSYTNQAVNIDTTTAKGKEVFARLVKLYSQYNQSEDEKLMQEMIAGLAAYSGLTEEQVIQAASLGNVLIQGGNNACYNTKVQISEFPYHYTCRLLLPSKKGQQGLLASTYVPLIQINDGFTLWQGQQRLTVKGMASLVDEKKPEEDAVYVLAASTLLLNPLCFSEIQKMDKEKK